MPDVKQQEVKVEFTPETKRGVYANNMMVTHSREEFIMDFIMITPPWGTVTSRVIVSPGHMKRILNALHTNVEKYEQKFGAVKPAEEPRGTIQ